MENEYKQKNDVPDLYNILGLKIDVCQDPNCNEIIQKAYIKKAKICHPDKHPGRKDIAEVFELITSAYDILKDEKQRITYNNKLTLNKQSSNDFGKLKKSADDYAKTLGEYVPANDQQKIAFKEKMKQLNIKHGYDSSMESIISRQDAKKRMTQMAKSRAEEYEQLKPDKLFDGGPFDIKKFNEAFDIVHNKEESAIIPHNGVPAAWNDQGGTNNFSTFDKLDNLYVDDNDRYDTGRQTYGGVNFGQPNRKITKEEVEKLKGADYVDGHNVLGDDYYRIMKQKLRDRESDASNFEKMKYGEFKRNETAGYGIFDQLGLNYSDRLELDNVDEEDISKKFERLMAARQMDDFAINKNQNTTNERQQNSGNQNRRAVSGGR